MYIQLFNHSNISALIQVDPDSLGVSNVLQDWCFYNTSQYFQHFINHAVGPIVGGFPYL